MWVLLWCICFIFQTHTQVSIQIVIRRVYCGQRPYWKVWHSVLRHVTMQNIHEYLEPCVHTSHTAMCIRVATWNLHNLVIDRNTNAEFGRVQYSLHASCIYTKFVGLLQYCVCNIQECLSTTTMRACLWIPSSCPYIVPTH